VSARRRSPLAFGAMVLAAPRLASAQVGRVARVGYLSATSFTTDGHRLASFERALRDLGYVEGKNIRLERRHASGQAQKLAELAQELVESQPHVIVTYGGIEAIRKASATIPIVMTVHADPLRGGVVASLARPGGQVTRLSDLHAEIAPKRLELLKEASPSLTRVGVLFNPAAPVMGSAQVQDVVASDVMTISARSATCVADARGRPPSVLKRAFAAAAGSNPYTV
jgi:putative ABC transport system substrate-binding protein